MLVLHLTKFGKCKIYLKSYEEGLGTVSEAQAAAGRAVAATIISWG